MAMISVIIPLYNKERFVGRALDSVFAQTINDYELIVVDDGSTDDGLRIVRSYNDPRIRLIEQPNAGPGAARNRGLREAKGEYVAFLDADDRWMPEYLETSLKILENHPECDICTSAWYQECECGRELPAHTSIIDLYTKNGLVISDGPLSTDTVPKKTNLLDLWWTSTVFVRKSIIRHNDYRFFPRKHYGEDFYLWLQLAFNHTFYRNTTSLAWYHNSATEFAKGLYTRNPLEAFLLWPEEIMGKTEPRRRKKLRRWLAAYALNAAHARLGFGQVVNARCLVKKYPDMMRVSPISFLRLLGKLGVYRVLGGRKRMMIEDRRWKVEGRRRQRAAQERTTSDT